MELINVSKLYSGKGEIPGLKELVSQFNMTETAAKKTLSTIGEFAKGLGQSQKYIKTFSTDLAKAAADFAAYKGLEDVEEVAKKFAKATLGEVGELKDIGIAIDVQSQAFKNLTQSIMEATGASEAQAKQMAITQEILKQVEHTSGTAATRIFDGWTQLNLLMDQFKEVLAEVGGIFSSVFGPILAGLNAILAIPFVKSTVAWGIALTAVTVGYGYLIATLNKLKKILRGNAEAEKLTTSEVAKALDIQRTYLALKEQQLKATEKIFEYEQRSAELYEQLKRKGLRANEKGTKEAAERASLASLASRQRKKVIEPADAAIKELENSLDSLSKETLEGIAGISGLDSEFVTLVSTLAAAKTATQLSTGAIIANTIATKANALAKNFDTVTNAIKTGITALPKLITGLFKLIGTGIVGLGKSIGGLITKLAASTGLTTGVGTAGAAGAAGTAGAATAASAATTASTGLAASLGALAASLGALLATVAAVAAAVTIVAMAFEGLWKWLVDGESFVEGFFHGAIATSIADFVANIIWGLDEIEEKSKELDEQIKKTNQDMATLQGLKDDLAKLRMDEALKHLLPADLAATLAKRTKEVQAEAKKYEWMIANMATARQRGMYSLGQDETVSSKRIEFQKKLNELTREQFQLTGQLEQATANLKKQLEELAALDDELVDIKWERMLEQASPAEARKLLQEDLFGIVEDLKATGDRIKELKRLIASNPEKQANYTAELIEQQKLFNRLTREQYATEDKLARLDEELKKQLASITQAQEEFKRLKLDRLINGALPKDALVLLRKRLTQLDNEIKTTSNEINSIRMKMVKNPGKQADFTEQLLEAQKRLTQLTRERYAVEDNIARQQERLTQVNREFSDQLHGQTETLIKDGKKLGELTNGRGGNSGINYGPVVTPSASTQIASKVFSETPNINAINEIKLKLLEQLKDLKETEEEYSRLHLDRILDKALPQAAIRQLKVRFRNYTYEINDTAKNIYNLRDLILRNPSKRVEYTAQLLEEQKRLNELTRERYNIEDNIASQEQRLIDINREFSAQLSELTKNFQSMKESLSWGYDKNGKFGNYSEAARLKNITNTYNQLVKRINRLAGKSDNRSLEERETLMRRYMELVKEESEIRLASLQEQREAAISNLSSMIDLVKQAKEFRETAQQGIEANTTEALRLQSRRPGEVNDGALKPVVEQQKAVREIEGKMLEVQRKSVSALTTINNSLNRVIRNLGKNAGATSVDVVPAI